MVFLPPAGVPKLPEVPDNISIDQFLCGEQYGRQRPSDSQIPYVCGITGHGYSAIEVVNRIDHLSRAIKNRLDFKINDGSEWDRVVAVYSINTIDYIPLVNSIHRLSGVVTPVSAAYTVSELEHQLLSSGAKAIFTCKSLLQNAQAAAENVGISPNKIFLLRCPQTTDEDEDASFTTVDQLIHEGSTLPTIPPLNWPQGQGKRQTAFLCYSSGTSGLPKGTMVSHYNIIANILQCFHYDLLYRKEMSIITAVCIGILSFSHIYGLTYVAHVSQYRGDSVIVLPRFELTSFLSSIERFKIQSLSLVPPIMILLISNTDLCAKYDLTSAQTATSGAAPLRSETIDSMRKILPQLKIVQGYGITESSPAVSYTSPFDIWPGSSGCLIPGCKAKIIDADGRELTEYGQSG